MKKKIFILILPIAALMTGCDEQARRFAVQTKAILDQRSAQLSRKIAAEMQGYSNYAAKAAEDHHTIGVIALANDRAERATALAIDYQEHRKPDALWRTDLAEYASADYESSKQLLMSDLDAEATFLQHYESLAIEKNRVDALAKLLGALAQKQSLKDEIAAVAGFAEDTKLEFDKKVCADLKSKQDAASKKLFADKKCDSLK